MRLLKFLRDGAFNVFWALVATGISAYFVSPDVKIDLGDWGLALLSVPLFFLLGAAALGALSLYAIVNLLEFLAVKLGFFDLIDGDGGF